MNTRSSTAAAAAAASASSSSSSSELEVTRATTATQARLATVEKQLSALQKKKTPRAPPAAATAVVAAVCQHPSRLLMCTWNKEEAQSVCLTYQLDPSLPSKKIEYTGYLPLLGIESGDTVRWNVCLSCHKLIGLPELSIEEWRRRIVEQKYGSDDEEDHSDE